MSAPQVDRAALARQGAFWTAVAAAAKTRAEAARHQLDQVAAAEYARDRIAPTWRIPGLGTVPFGTTRAEVVVADAAKYLAWVAERHPTEVESRVREAFDIRLRRVLADRGEPLCDDEGTVIPGLRYEPGGMPRGVSIRPDRAAKERFAEAAEELLAGVEQPGGGS